MTHYEKGVAGIGNGSYAWLQPDGGWGLSNAGLVTSDGEALLVDTMFDYAHTPDICFADFSNWGDAERIAVNTATLYREFGAKDVPSDAATLFGWMAQIWNDRKGRRP